MTRENGVDGSVALEYRTDRSMTLEDGYGDNGSVALKDKTDLLMTLGDRDDGSGAREYEANSSVAFIERDDGTDEDGSVAFCKFTIYLYIN